MKYSRVAGDPAGHGTHGDAVEVVRAAFPPADVSRGRGHHPGQVTVERRPQGQEIFPARLLVVLQGHPLVLVVAGEDQVVLKRRSDESLVVVRRRIDQVADDLARRPLPRRRPAAGDVVAEGTKPGQRLVDGVRQIDGAGGHGAGCGRDLRGGGQVMVVVLGDEETEIHDGHRLIEARMARHARQLRRRPAGQPIDDFRSCSAKCVDQIARVSIVVPGIVRPAVLEVGRVEHLAPLLEVVQPACPEILEVEQMPGMFLRGPAPVGLVDPDGPGHAVEQAAPGDRGPRAADRAAGARRRRAVPSRRCGRTSVSRTEMLVRSQAVRNKRCGAVVKTSASALRSHRLLRRDRLVAGVRGEPLENDAPRGNAVSEPRERSEPPKRLARERVGESEGRSPSEH